MNRTLLGVAIGLLITSCAKTSDVYNILDFGANGDGETMNTKAINDAIRACNENGGGTVLVPAGEFYTGTIELLSNVNLHLSSGSKLIASNDTIDYKPMENVPFNEGYNRYGLVYAYRIKNFSITGLGELNGNGTHFMNGLDKPHMGGYDWDRQYTRQGENYMPEGAVFEDGPVSYQFRPGMLMTIQNCENVKILDVTLKDTPEWTIRLQDCENVEFRGVTIRTNPLIPNSDGINCMSSRNIRISDCDILAGDDAIIVNGFGNGILPGESYDTTSYIGNSTGYAENVVVTNCVLSSRSSCIRVGYGHHPIRNLIFSNLVMHASNRGIGVFARDKSSIENVLFDNIIITTRLHSGHWWGKGEPIHLSAVQERDGIKIGRIHDIRFSNIIATAETGIIIYGSESSTIDEVSFKDVKLTIRKGKYTDTYGGNFDLRPAAKKSEALFSHDIPGLFAQYVAGLSIDGMQIVQETGLPDFFTHGLEVNHFNGLVIQEYQFAPSLKGDNQYSVKLTNGVNYTLNIPSSESVKKENVKQ